MAERKYGVDVSSYQDINVTKYGGKFVIVKSTQGTYYHNPNHEAQIDNAKSAGLLAMEYHYANFSNNISAAINEANYASNHSNVDKGSYIWCDWETGDGNITKGSKSSNTQAILAFMDAITNAGYKTGLYSGASLLKNNIDPAQILAKYPNCLWVASYPVAGAVSKPDFGYFPSMEGVAIWQFTDNWKGLSVDGNISLIDLKTDGVPTSQPSKPVVKQPISQSFVDELGDTWYKEEGKFYPNGTINIRYGARTTSDIIGTVTNGDCVKYDAYSRHGGYVWIRQPRANGQPGFLVCRQGNDPWGRFE